MYHTYGQTPVERYSTWFTKYQVFDPEPYQEVNINILGRIQLSKEIYLIGFQGSTQTAGIGFKSEVCGHG